MNKMTETTKDLTSFVKEVISRIKGDDSEALALKNERKARAAINQQVSALENRIVDNEVAVEEAQEKYDNILYPTTLIEDGAAYIKNVKNNYEALEVAKETLEDTKLSLEFFKKLLKEKF